MNEFRGTRRRHSASNVLNDSNAQGYSVVICEIHHHCGLSSTEIVKRMSDLDGVGSVNW
jgi:hypothetical protein